MKTVEPEVKETEKQESQQPAQFMKQGPIKNSRTTARGAALHAKSASFQPVIPIHSSHPVRLNTATKSKAIPASF